MILLNLIFRSNCNQPLGCEKSFCYFTHSYSRFLSRTVQELKEMLDKVICQASLIDSFMDLLYQKMLDIDKILKKLHQEGNLHSVPVYMFPINRYVVNN